jgi:ribonuclease P protein component
MGELSSHVAGRRVASDSRSPTNDKPDQPQAGVSRQRLTAAQRIRYRPEFERVYKEGARVHGRLMTLFVLPSDRATRLGVAATRKIGSAVARNRAKRLAREVFRRTASVARLDVVIVPRREMLDAPFERIEADYLATLERARRQAASGSASRTRGEPRSRHPQGV